ncbi:unnamed protein product [Cuscuta europaea]|uniref:Uncharacterized protein n=1 Tax=Cuscuta europaea TaxID=41803 RepID=A0A9P1EE57_CUSEU|nr:unnamed protein product [Cuscuta europaea]
MRHSNSFNTELSVFRDLSYCLFLCRPVSFSPEKYTVSTSKDYKPKVNAGQPSGTNVKIQQARNLAVAQAQQDGCTANFRIFDSPFGNFLVPVLPTLVDLGL